MAVPKSKISRTRRDKRRNAHWKIKPPNIIACSECGAYRLPHRACKACGVYNGREVIQIKTTAE